MFGRDIKQRGRRMDECLAAIKQAWSGEAFTYQGRRVRVTPKPQTPGGPPLLMGGNTEAVVRRAARFGMGMLCMGGNPALDAIYQKACAEFGTAPQLFINHVGEMPTSCFVAEDPEHAWSQIGPYMLHDARMYAEWLVGQSSISKSVAADVAQLRKEEGAYRIFTPAEAAAFLSKYKMLMTQPLCGGLPPEIAWQSLELLAKKVLPAAKA